MVVGPLSLLFSAILFSIATCRNSSTIADSVSLSLGSSV
jgi:hypothetical protein